MQWHTPQVLNAVNQHLTKLEVYATVRARLWLPCRLSASSQPPCCPIDIGNTCSDPLPRAQGCEGVVEGLGDVAAVLAARDGADAAQARGGWCQDDWSWMGSSTTWS